jgi:hypothetical protein
MSNSPLHHQRLTFEHSLPQVLKINPAKLTISLGKKTGVCSPRTDNIKTAGVSVSVNQFCGDGNGIIIHQSARTSDKSYEFCGGVCNHHRIKNTGNDIMTPRGSRLFRR